MKAGSMRRLSIIFSIVPTDIQILFNKSLKVTFHSQTNVSGIISLLLFLWWQKRLYGLQLFWLADFCQKLSHYLLNLICKTLEFDRISTVSFLVAVSVQLLWYLKIRL